MKIVRNWSFGEALRSRLGRARSTGASRAGAASALASCSMPRISADGIFCGGGCADAAAAAHGSTTARPWREAARLARSAELDGVCSARGSTTLPMGATICMAI